MVKDLYLYSYKQGSRSAKALVTELGIKQIRHQNSKFKGKQRKTVINWGSSELPFEVQRCGTILNHSLDVQVVSNKLSFFRTQTPIQGLEESYARLVPWTIDREEAQTWSDEGSTVVIRNSLTGHSGFGILIVEPEEIVPEAPLYTKYIKKDSEWRIHILKGNVIFKQRKIKNPNIEEPATWKIRSHQNGFIFQQNNLEVPPDVEKQALLSFGRSGLDFGAVDVIYNKKKNEAYVLEINTAPGLEGTTVEIYANVFKSFIEGG